MSDDKEQVTPDAPAATGNNSRMSGFPSNFQPLVFETFNGLNTKAPRPGIRDSECSWIDGFMPIGPNNIRTLYGTGTPIANLSQNGGVVWFGFGNIADTKYCYILSGAGALLTVNLDTLAGGTILAPGSIKDPDTFFAFSQWGSQYALFGTDQLNGYWLWDGTNVYTAGTIGPQVTVTQSGQGYSNEPNYTVVTTGNGTGVGLDFELQNGQVSQVTVTNPGTGFGVYDFTTVYLTDGGTDSSAIVSALTPTTPHQGGGSLAEVYVIAGGTGYTGYAYAFIGSGGGGSGASISLSIQNGTITGAAIVTPGSGYRIAPQIAIRDPGVNLGGGSSIPGGSGGQIGCTIAFGQITTYAIASGGNNYRSPPTVTVMGDGTNATAIATVQDGQVTAIIPTNYGSGYTKGVAVLTGGNNAGNIALRAMPFGISGTTLEVYDNYVWDSNGGARATFPPKNRTIFSAPNSPVDFGDGGGAFQSTDSFLKVGVKNLKQSNGFLYLIADSSINYISNVQTTSAGSSNVPAIPTTTFGNLNVDPQIGTPWPASVQVFQRNIVFANTIGVYASYGGAVKKVSEPLDGFYSKANIYGPTNNFSSAVAQIFGIPVYMLLLPIVSPFSGQHENKLLMWDGTRWFTSGQDRQLTFIATAEYNSILTAYGTDGTFIFPLFTDPSTAFIKVFQSKLYSSPGYFTTKIARSLSGIFNTYIYDGNGILVSIDSEAGLGVVNAIQTVPPGSIGQWFNNSGNDGFWVNSHNAPGIWRGSTPINGVTVFGPYPMAQQGRLIGLTVSSQASDLAVVSVMASEPVWTPNV